MTYNSHRLFLRTTKRFPLKLRIVAVSLKTKELTNNFSKKFNLKGYIKYKITKAVPDKAFNEEIP